MFEIDIDVALSILLDTTNRLVQKHFVEKKELSRNEQILLNDMQSLVLQDMHKEIIRKHFSTKI